MSFFLLAVFLTNIQLGCWLELGSSVASLVLKTSMIFLTESSSPLRFSISISFGSHGQFVVAVTLPLAFFQAKRYGFYSFGQAFDLIMSVLSA